MENYVEVPIWLYNKVKALNSATDEIAKYISEIKNVELSKEEKDHIGVIISDAMIVASHNS